MDSFHRRVDGPHQARGRRAEDRRIVADAQKDAGGSGEGVEDSSEPAEARELARFGEIIYRRRGRCAPLSVAPSIPRAPALLIDPVAMAETIPSHIVAACSA